MSNPFLQKEQLDFNLLEFIKEFIKNDKLGKDGKRGMKYGFNKLSSKEDMLLQFSNNLLKKVDIIPKDCHVCNGGTCTHGICSALGKIVKCDTGCTYLG